MVSGTSVNIILNLSSSGGASHSWGQATLVAPDAACLAEDMTVVEKRLAGREDQEESGVLQRGVEGGATRRGVT
ncbi:hypothetical protein B0T26DRAFT_718099 [Lasiosphaeria miniovina]|uniref:Uncharacterized protein n=1 Tax=Lasiosphaeria miniovina TaxID=1954250 RepID=A0AA40AD52_9PEZI|nr:uncharacterized protein B0T26DRAFT_718099 [Lasiosphaeria miniovina]KAK0713678.1 hypothetical protein B0T26DRAFT_718099 [Lasiosphaeria miniovina]